MDTPLTFTIDALRANPELAIFLTLAAGFLIGRIRIGSFTLGNVVGTLLAGVVIGQLHIAVSPLVKVVFFDLFLFATGYKVGPQFFRGLKKNALPQVALTVVLCLTSLITTLVAAHLLGYDSGTAAGLMAGAFTESTVIGTAGNAIAQLDLSDAEKERLINNIPVAYAVSYLVGTGFVVWLLSNLAPRLLRVDLKAESRKLAEQMGGLANAAGQPAAYREWDLRAYQLAPAHAGRQVGELERSFAPDRMFVLRIRRQGSFLEPSYESTLLEGDIVALAGRRSVQLAEGARVGREVADPELLDFPTGVADIVVTHGAMVDRSLSDLASEFGRGVVLVKLTRGGEDIPHTADTRVERGDLLRVTGSRADVDRVGAVLGYLERQTSETDVVFLGLGIVVGGLLGVLSITVWDLPLSLTASGGALIMGLAFGWLRSVRPTFGRIPEPALWVFDSIGLAVFIAVVGLGAGPSFVQGLRETGPSLLVVGFCVATTPHVVALLFGRYVLKMNPVILLGACAGAGTVTAALRAIQDEADSRLPVLGYTVPYAVGNILLTAWGPVIVLFTQ